jgi:hypothetical protein
VATPTAELAVDVGRCVRALAATPAGAAELWRTHTLRFTAQALAAQLAHAPGPSPLADLLLDTHDLLWAHGRSAFLVCLRSHNTHASDARPLSVSQTPLRRSTMPVQRPCGVPCPPWPRHFGQTTTSSSFACCMRSSPPCVRSSKCVYPPAPGRLPHRRCD